ncbi:MAG: AbrB/MazE/SpoVT family DNA-binding domain-containing protein [Thermofilum sp.]|nr:AbrB/MazE/SpoVT family DNA-binding domain-containing protein [Thermofilum sp.]
MLASGRSWSMMATGEKPRRGSRGLPIDALPYKVRIYSNNQVLVPARLVRKLGIQNLRYAVVRIRIQGSEYTLHVKLLRTKYTDSRQFTIPKEIREKHGLSANSEVEILEIRPPESPDQQVAGSGALR